MIWNIKNIGTFTLTSGTMRVSDPCYNKNVWCSGTIPNCLTGEWQAGVAYYHDVMWGKRVALLAAKATDGKASFEMLDNFRTKVWDNTLERVTFEVGVDSGQAGMYDDATFGLDSTVEDLPKPEEIIDEEPGGLWYSVCCEATDGEDHAGTIPTGVISRSGFGDGGYTAVYHKDENGKVDMIAILYIDPDLEDQVDDEDDDDEEEDG